MVGIVVVSHSSELARGLALLAGQMASSGVRIEHAGGTADGALGTDEGRKLLEELQRTTDRHVGEVDRVGAAKEQEVLEV